MEGHLISNISIQDLIDIIRSVVREEIKAAKESESYDKLLSPKEVCSLFKVTVPTLNSWTEKGQIQKHYLGSRVYYKYGELMEALAKIKLRVNYVV
jgi:excisionase family DNA binding protein